MEWSAYPENRPNRSQTYLVSIELPRKKDVLVFNYLAYYNAETNTWHKYDSFIAGEVQEPIKEKILGFVELTAYLG